MAIEQSEPKKKGSIVPRIILIAVLGTVAFVGGRAYIHSSTHEETDNAQIEANTLPVMSRVPGYIKALKVADYTSVTKGDTLVLLDSEEFEIAVQQAEADLLQAEADAEGARATIGSNGANTGVALANLQAAQTRLDKAMADQARDESLFADRSITRRQLEDTKASVDNQRKLLAVAKEQIALTRTTGGASAAQIHRSAASISVKKAALASAKLRLSYTTIRANATGKTGKNSMEPGQFVAAGQTLFNLVDNSHFWVMANFKETQLKHLKLGQKVLISLDAYPKEDIVGTISSFSQATGAKFSLLPPDNATGNFVKVTQRIPVKILLDDEAKWRPCLKAGLSAKVEAKIED